MRIAEELINLTRVLERMGNREAAKYLRTNDYGYSWIIKAVNEMSSAAWKASDLITVPAPEDTKCTKVKIYRD